MGASQSELEAWVDEGPPVTRSDSRRKMNRGDSSETKGTRSRHWCLILINSGVARAKSPYLKTLTFRYQGIHDILSDTNGKELRGQF